MRYVIAIIVSLALLSCADYSCRKPICQISTPAVSKYLDDGILPELKIVKYNSHTDFICTSVGARGQMVKYIASICAANKCDTSVFGQAKLSFWSDSWDTLYSIDKVHCTVTRPEEIIWENFQIKEVIPEKLSAAATASVSCDCSSEDQGTSYCGDGYWDESGWHCTYWYE